MSDNPSPSTQPLLAPIVSLPAAENLAALVAYWQGEGLLHRVVEQQDKQVIYAEEAAAERVYADVQRFLARDPALVTELAPSVAATLTPDGRELGAKALRLFQEMPVTLSMVLLSVLGFFIATFQLQPLYDLMVIQSMDRVGAMWLGLPVRIGIEEFLAHGHYWRLLTPVFLHFGWMHILFNMIWLVELGRRIERSVGSLHLLMVILFIGIASNLWQAESTPYADFGGMSGVIYGLLAYCWVFNTISGDERFVLPKAVYVVMLGSLLLGYSGLLDSFVLMANTAHLMGLVYGLVIALPSALVYRWRG